MGLVKLCTFDVLTFNQMDFVNGSMSPLANIIQQRGVIVERSPDNMEVKVKLPEVKAVFHKLQKGLYWKFIRGTL